MNLHRRMFLFAAATTLATAVLAESIYGPIGQILQNVFETNAGKVLAEALIDVSNADGELDDALSVAPSTTLADL